MKSVTMGIANNLTEAEVALFLLERAGIPSFTVSVIFPDKRRTRAFAHDHRAIGSLIAVGPILKTFGATTGLVAALATLGVAERDARRFEGQVLDGNILVAVHVEATPIVRMVRSILERGGLHGITTTTTAVLMETLPSNSVHAELRVG